MNLPLFLARRIYAQNNDDRRKVSKPAIRIATAGVAIGLAVMIISLCVVLGFKHTIRDKVAGFGSHVQVADFYTLQSVADRPILVNDSLIKKLQGIKGVKHVQRFAMKQGILKTDDDFLGVCFKGVDEDFDSTFIHDNMVEGHIPTFNDNGARNDILLSKSIATRLKVKTGDRIFAYFLGESGARTRRLNIAGIYETSLSHYDDITCFCNLATAVRLNGWEPGQVSGAEITVDDFGSLDETAEKIAASVGNGQDKYGSTYCTMTIRQVMPQIFSWLDLLDLNVWIILVIMTAVAVVTMASGLLIIILERTQMIGILKALGARNDTVRHTFLWFASFIIGRALIIGNVIGLGIMLIQKYTGIVRLDPKTYYTDTVPVEINMPLIVALNIATLAVAMTALIAPSYLAAKIKPAKSMRYE